MKAGRALDLLPWGTRRYPFVKDAVRNIEAWESAHRAVEDAS